MCANYLPATAEQLQRHFDVAPPDAPYAAEAFPGRMAPMIRPPAADSLPGDRACALAMFGLVPHWAKFELARQTFNARSETAATKPSFRNAYRKRQFCIIAAASFYEPNYETGKPVRWEITHANREPLAIAGIWEYRAAGPNGLPLLSFSMLTVNADADPLMRRFHKPDEEKRMVVILRPEQYDAWLHCPPDDATNFFHDIPTDQLTAAAAPRNASAPARAAQGTS
jgi:putative SOS response-associated peptidase YedK